MRYVNMSHACWRVCAGGRKICAGAIMCVLEVWGGAYGSLRSWETIAGPHKGIVSRLWRGLAVTGRRYTIDVFV